MEEKVVYVHSIKSVPFYVGAGTNQRSKDTKNRSTEWNEIVNKNNGKFDVEIIYKGCEIECKKTEQEFIQKYKDTVVNISHGAYQAIQLKTPDLNKVKTNIAHNLKLARLRRGISLSQMAERANITRLTLAKIESGKFNTSFDVILNLAFCLGMHIDLANVFCNDTLGYKLTDANLLLKKRVKK